MAVQVVTMETLVDELFAWYCDGGDIPPHLFAGKFRFVGQTELESSDVWLLVCAQHPAWQDVTVVGRIVASDQACLVFEGVDPITSLKHRIAWFISTQGGRISTLVETSSIVQRGSS